MRRRPATSLLSRRGVDVADSTAAVLRFESGAIGSFANTRRLASAVIEVEFVSDGLLTTLTKRPERGQGDWHATLRRRDGHPRRSAPERDPYEKQAAAFLDAVEAGDPSRRPVDLRRRAQDRPADAGRGGRDGRARADASAGR